MCYPISHIILRAVPAMLYLVLIYYCYAQYFIFLSLKKINQVQLLTHVIPPTLRGRDQEELYLRPSPSKKLVRPKKVN
jgi:hypothetical protein